MTNDAGKYAQHPIEAGNARPLFPSNEYALIDRIQRCLPPVRTDHPYELTIGDDAAVRLNSKAGERLIITADVFVENVHFSVDTMTFKEIGCRAMAANLSDCAAMGAQPDSAVIQLVFPKDNANINTSVEQIYTGFADMCSRWDFPIVGGDLSGGDSWIIGITLIGSLLHGRILKRTGIIDGDALWVTGTPGMSAAGLACIRRWGRKNVPAKYQQFVDAHVCPIPKIDEGKAFAACESVHAMMDLSDGLSKDASTLCYDNNLGFIFDKGINIPASMTELAKDLGCNPLDWYFHGGEEYELLVSCGNGYTPAGENMIRLGHFTSEYTGIYTHRDDGGMERLVSRSWDHCR